LALAALLLMGYHPFVDDAAIYVAGVEKIVSPGLFQRHAEYILPHLQHSLFSLGLGQMVRLTHAPLLPSLFAAYVFSLWLTVLACWRLSRLLFTHPRAQWGATTLLAVTMTLPVAGTALFFMDPYLTARSYSTPVVLFALAYAMERKALRAALCLFFAVLLHPLMGAYAVVYVAAFWLLRDKHWRALVGLTLLVFAGTALAALLPAMHHATPGYRAAALSRSYFFLNHWEWYEVFGLFPPLVASWIYCARGDFRLQGDSSNVYAASAYVGAMTLLFSSFFVHVHGPLLLASLQPLRMFHLIYILFFLLLGGVLGEHVLRHRSWTWALCFGAVGAIMLIAQLRTYPDLAHIEWPWATPQNPWEQAFLWIRNNTPDNSLFALDPHYQSLPGENTLGFRAVAERSALPDWNKDGGVAAIYPQIAPEWFSEARQEQGWNRWTDQQRLEHLGAYQVDWVVLTVTQPTQLPCPYQNALVRVCQLDTETAHLRPPTPPTTQLP
jgi:hypothetical protein